MIGHLCNEGHAFLCRHLFPTFPHFYQTYISNIPPYIHTPSLIKVTKIVVKKIACAYIVIMTPQKLLLIIVISKSIITIKFFLYKL